MLLRRHSLGSGVTICSSATISLFKHLVVLIVGI